MLQSSQIQEFLKQRRYDDVEKALTRDLKDHPKSADTHYYLGVLRHYQGNLGEAIEYLKKAVELDPKHTDASICLSVLYNDLGKYDEARLVFHGANQSITYTQSSNTNAIDRKFSMKHIELADLYLRYRRYEEAIEEYGKALLLDPTNTEIKIRRAKAFAKKGFVTRAIQELQKLRDEHPRLVEVPLQLGLLHFSQGNVLDAELEWERVQDAEPGNEKAEEYLAMARRARIAAPSPETSH